MCLYICICITYKGQATQLASGHKASSIPDFGLWLLPECLLLILYGFLWLCHAKELPKIKGPHGGPPISELSHTGLPSPTLWSYQRGPGPEVAVITTGPHVYTWVP